MDLKEINDFGNSLLNTEHSERFLLLLCMIMLGVAEKNLILGWAGACLTLD